MDNGSDMIAQALNDRCRFNTSGTIHIESGSPWQNSHIESFNSWMRDEHWNVEEFTTLTEAQILTEQWRIEYSTIRPHSALAGHPPDEYAAQADVGIVAMMLVHLCSQRKFVRPKRIEDS